MKWLTYTGEPDTESIIFKHSIAALCPLLQKRKKKSHLGKEEHKIKIGSSLTECLKFRKLVLLLQLDIVTISKHLGYVFQYIV